MRLYQIIDACPYCTDLLALEYHKEEGSKRHYLPRHKKRKAVSHCANRHQPCVNKQEAYPMQTQRTAPINIGLHVLIAVEHAGYHCKTDYQHEPSRKRVNGKMYGTCHLRTCECGIETMAEKRLNGRDTANHRQRNDATYGDNALAT